MPMGRDGGVGLRAIWKGGAKHGVQSVWSMLGIHCFFEKAVNVPASFVCLYWMERL